MTRVTFRFYAGLNDFLAPHRRRARFTHHLRSPASVKDTVEALGVPHPEIDLLLLNGEPVRFAHRLADGDDVAVFPRFFSFDVGGRVGGDPPAPLRFVADVHLGRLAAYLRLAGFDTRLVEDDADVALLSAREERVALTRDVALLKRSMIRFGRWIRQTDPEAQLREVADAFALADGLRPFTRCLVCNGRSVEVDGSVVAALVPPAVLARFQDFRRCEACGRVYWRGTHYQRLLQLVAGLRVRSA